MQPANSGTERGPAANRKAGRIVYDWSSKTRQGNGKDRKLKKGNSRAYVSRFNDSTFVVSTGRAVLGSAQSRYTSSPP
eukprot:4175678-Pleurochrysis_carterae.AAC.1